MYSLRMPANVAVPKRQWRIRLAKIKQFFLPVKKLRAIQRAISPFN